MHKTELLVYARARHSSTCSRQLLSPTASRLISGWIDRAGSIETLGDYYFLPEDSLSREQSLHLDSPPPSPVCAPAWNLPCVSKALSGGHSPGFSSSLTFFSSLGWFWEFVWTRRERDFLCCAAISGCEEFAVEEENECGLEIFTFSRDFWLFVEAWIESGSVLTRWLQVIWDKRRRFWNLHLKIISKTRVELFIIHVKILFYEFGLVKYWEKHSTS